jgi:hypothetical protein
MMVFKQMIRNNSKKQENGIGVKASGRSQKIPVTRRDDFLWTVNSKKHSR